jgi:plexin A
MIQIYLFQVVVESGSSALEYGDIAVDETTPVNPDLHFDSQLMHLYVMTEKKVN